MERSVTLTLLLTVLNGSIGKRELTKVVTDHGGLDINEVVTKTLVDSNLRADHLGEDDSGTEVSLDDSGAASLISVGLSLAETLKEVLVDGVTTEATASTGVEHVEEVLLGNIDELISFNTTVVEDTEGLLGISLNNRNEMRGGIREVQMFPSVSLSNSLMKIVQTVFTARMTT